VQAADTVSKAYFRYRQIEFWLLCLYWELLRIAFPTWQMANWTFNRRLDYVEARLREARAGHSREALEEK
jgi:hypothetical protein